MVSNQGLTAYWFRDVGNFGDKLAPFLLEAVTGQKPIWVKQRAQGKVLGPGSVIDRVQPGDRVWGSGILKPEPVDVPETAEVLVVRGPLTRAMVRGDVPELYGDPALLLPHFYDNPQKRKHDVGLIPHYADKRYVTLNDRHDRHVLTINIQAPWRAVVDLIRQCALVVSTSLHGIIVAEAYGIPAIWLTAGDRLVGGPLKFYDYYLGTDRDPPKVARWTGRLPICDPPPLPKVDLGPLLTAGEKLR